MHLSVSSNDEPSLMLLVDAIRVDYVQSVRSVIHLGVVATKNLINFSYEIPFLRVRIPIKKLIYKLTGEIWI